MSFNSEANSIKKETKKRVHVSCSKPHSFIEKVHEADEDSEDNEKNGKNQKNNEIKMYGKESDSLKLLADRLF